MKLGVIADVHWPSTAAARAAWHNPFDFAALAERLDRARHRFDSDAVDAIVVCGDLTHGGDRDSLRAACRRLVGTVLQLSAGAVVEAPHEVAIVDVSIAGTGVRVRRRIHCRGRAPAVRDPVLAPRGRGLGVRPGRLATRGLQEGARRMTAARILTTNEFVGSFFWPTATISDHAMTQGTRTRRHPMKGRRNPEMSERIGAMPVRYPFSFVIAGDSGAWPDPTADAIYAQLLRQTARLAPLQCSSPIWATSPAPAHSKPGDPVVIRAA